MLQLKGGAAPLFRHIFGGLYKAEVKNSGAQLIDCLLNTGHALSDNAGAILKDVSLQNGSDQARALASGIPAIGKVVTYAKRHAVFHQGDAATHLFWIERGAVMLQQYLEDGRRQLVEIVLPGGIVGIARDDVYSATCETLQPSDLRSCSKAELEFHPEFGWLVEHQIERQLCAAQEHALALGRMTAQERVCALLLRFVEEVLLAQAGSSRIEQACDVVDLHLPMTRGEIGDYLGLSLETVCRTLTNLKRKGVIEVGPHHGDMVVKRLERLRTLGVSSS